MTAADHSFPSDVRERRQSQLNLLLEARSLKKSSSCSTIFLDDSTISHPNLKNTIKCVSLAIQYHFQDRGQGDAGSKTYAIFDERIHPLSQDGRDIRVPDHRTIYRFMRTLFNAAQLPPECAIITLVYVERLLTYAETDIDAYNWKRIVLGSILLASKVMILTPALTLLTPLSAHRCGTIRPFGTWTTARSCATFLSKTCQSFPLSPDWPAHLCPHSQE